MTPAPIAPIPVPHPAVVGPPTGISPSARQALVPPTSGSIPLPLSMGGRGSTAAQASMLNRALDQRIVGHRGSREGDHGNTIASLERAAAQGAKWIELDIHRTLDDQLVVLHDPKVNARFPALVNLPVVNALSGGQRVSSLTRDQLPKVDGQEVPTLDGLLSRAKELGLKVVAELKEPGYEGRVVDAVRRTHSDQDALFISFSKDAVRAIEQLAPEVRTGLLLVDPARMIPGVRSIKNLIASADAPVRAAASVGADFVAVHDAMAGTKLLGAAQSAGMPVAVWTVNDPARAAQLLQHPQVAAVISDVPGAVRQAVGLPLGQHGAGIPLGS